MTLYHYDLIVIGAGSGGVRASRMAARTGARVAIVESGALGGTCVNVGCVPKKLFYYGADFQSAWEDATGYGWQSAPPVFNWETLRDNKTKEIERLNAVYQRILEQAQVKILHGHAKLISAHEILIHEKVYTSKRILIATGSVAETPDFPGAELASVSDALFYLPQFPKRVIVVGGGYIASEFSGTFSKLGAQVTQLYRGALFLKNFDIDIRHHTAAEMRKHLDLRFNSTLVKIEQGKNGLIAHLNDDTQIETDLVLYAAGRKPNTAHLGLKEVGVQLDHKNAIVINEYWQTSVPSIYALGDVIDRFQLTPVAIAEAMAFVKTIYENKPTTVDYSLIPTAVFCDPNIATVGLTEQAARKNDKAIKIFKSKFKPLKHTLSGRNTEIFMKLVVDQETDKVLGIHMVGENAGEIIQGFAAALTAGVTKAMLDATIGIHPTTAEEFVTVREAQ